MRVFISWSGERSKHVGSALRDWLPLLLHYVEPWLSVADIDAGDRWATEVGQQLNESGFGVLCLTRENLNSSWVLFEAGALSKSVETAAVVPYLLDVDYSDIAGPLAQFQAKKCDMQSTLELVRAINNRAPAPIAEARVASLFQALWPQLDAEIGKAPAPSTTAASSRSQKQVLEDLTEVVRSVERRTRVLDTLMPAEFQSYWGQEAHDALLGGNMVSAIKAVRQGTGVGLKEAKDFVDAWRAAEARRSAKPGGGDA